MSKATGIIEWFRGSSLVDDVQKFDVDQLGAEGEAGLYKQPLITRDRLLDGTAIITESYYMLFKKTAKLKSQRLSNEDFLESVENWVMMQDFEGSFPNIGYEVFSVEASNAFYMIERDSNDAVYQLTLSVKYLWEPTEEEETEGEGEE